MGRLDRLRGRWEKGSAGSSGATDQRAPDRAAARPLEAMVEALQDAIDRQATREDERLNELARRLQPSELARVLSEDARKRGF